jgi:hypothetical protein
VVIPHLSPEEQRQALDAFQYGVEALHAAMGGQRDAATDAIVWFQRCIEWATPDTWPELWKEALEALADAQRLRH